MSIVKKTTFCRVCEPACGLVASVENGELVALAPDKAHPITQGFACNKGIAGLEIHRDPDRLARPLKKQADGSFAALSWDDAAREIAQRLRAIVDESGPDAVAAYIGNPTAFNTLAGPAMGSFFGQLGTRRSFSSGTQDCTNKFAASEQVFGTATLHPVPDIGNTQYLLLIGENPRVSHMSFLGIADPVAELKAAGVSYEERMEELEKVTHKKPEEEFLEGAFEAFSRAHPWVLGQRIEPKSIVRDWYEQGLSFTSYIKEYGLERSEGVLLRYLSEAYRALERTVPEQSKTEELYDVIDWLGAEGSTPPRVRKLKP